MKKRRKKIAKKPKKAKKNGKKNWTRVRKRNHGLSSICLKFTSKILFKQTELISFLCEKRNAFLSAARLNSNVTRQNKTKQNDVRTPIVCTIHFLNSYHFFVKSAGCLHSFFFVLIHSHTESNSNDTREWNGINRILFV